MPSAENEPNLWQGEAHRGCAYYCESLGFNDDSGLAIRTVYVCSCPKEP